MMPTDPELVAEARGGSAAAVGALLERHRAGITAIAVRILGHGPDVEDIVHETFLVALTRIDRLRDADAAGAWLMGIARNLCLQRLRAAREVPVESFEPRQASDSLLPDEVLERMALREWVWSGLEQLSEPLRLPVILRHFTRATSYRDIAAICDVPIGTVRSRLNQARVKLGEALLEEAAGIDSDHDALARVRRRHFEDAYDEYNRGVGLDLLASSLEDEVEAIFEHGLVLKGRDALVRGLIEDVVAGVKLYIGNVIASRTITVVEGRFENPADDPLHCPPATTQVYLHDGAGIRAIRLHYGSR
jgi:RNA polymerase sigma factor (sigma-70 family)